MEGEGRGEAENGRREVSRETFEREGVRQNGEKFRTRFGTQIGRSVEWLTRPSEKEKETF